MRRGPEFEGIQQEAELELGLILGETDGLEYLFLDILAMNPDAAAAHLIAVDDHVIGLGPHGAGITVQRFHILRQGGRKGMMHRHIALIIRVPLQQRETGHPQGAVAVLGDQLQPFGHMHPQGRQRGVGHSRLGRHHQGHIANLHLKALNEVLLLCCI